MCSRLQINCGKKGRYKHTKNAAKVKTRTQSKRHEWDLVGISRGESSAEFVGGQSHNFQCITQNAMNCNRNDLTIKMYIVHDHFERWHFKRYTIFNKLNADTPSSYHLEKEINIKSLFIHTRRLLLIQ